MRVSNPMKRIEWYSYAERHENPQEFREWLRLAERWAGYMELLLRGGAEVASIAEMARGQVIQEGGSTPDIYHTSYWYMVHYLSECWERGQALMAWYAIICQSR